MLRRLHVFELQFSVYAADPAVHDAITGSYQRTLRGIHLVKEQGLDVRVAMPVMALNVDQVPAVEALCRELGVTFTRGPLIFPKNNGDLEPRNESKADKI
jgi:MoaA/NifB/PqqE/SkfB family radical SAM enzyme